MFTTSLVLDRPLSGFSRCSRQLTGCFPIGDVCHGALLEVRCLRLLLLENFVDCVRWHAVEVLQQRRTGKLAAVEQSLFIIGNAYEAVLAGILHFF